MSMSDCIRCWNAPCSCGWDYRDYSMEKLKEMRGIFDTIIKYKEENPNFKFSEFMDKETEDDKKLMKILNDKWKETLKRMNSFPRYFIHTKIPDDKSIIYIIHFSETEIAVVCRDEENGLGSIRRRSPNLPKGTSWTLEDTLLMCDMKESLEITGEEALFLERHGLIYHRQLFLEKVR